jgi:hypothetical protein
MKQVDVNSFLCIHIVMVHPKTEVLVIISINKWCKKLHQDLDCVLESR